MYDELVKRLREHNGWALNETLNEAADAIEELQKLLDGVSADNDSLCKQLDDMNEANIALYGALPKWIPVTERLPEDDTICILTNGVTEAIGYRGKVFGWHLIWTDYLVGGEVTHWMPLPEPPKEE